MNEQEFKKWLKDARFALRRAKYTSEEIAIIIEWFENLRTSHEYTLLGNDCFKAQCQMSDADHKLRMERGLGFNLYTNMMSRLWIYAPHIIYEHKQKEQQNEQSMG